VAALQILPDKPDGDAAGFFPLPEGFSMEPEPFSDAQIADLKALLSTAAAMPHAPVVPGQDSGTRTRAA